MPRIRTIKPEFPQSESMGRVSREARLFYILLWTVADDSGRLRAHSRILASLLYPFDTDVLDHIEHWIEELIEEECIVRYTHDNATYIQIANWLKHQKIDKPGASKLPAFDDDSRILANPREPSTTDLGSRIIGSRTFIRKGPEDPKSQEVFEKIKAAYPKGTYRDHGWLIAQRNVEHLLESEVSPAELLGFVLEYAAQQEAKGSVGTQYVLGPEKFFADGVWRGPFPLPKPKAKNGNGALSKASVTAWERLLASDGAERPPEVDRALKAIGGWQRVRMRTDFDALKIRAEFCHALETGHAG